MSRITYLMIQGNDVTFIDTPERSECWAVKDGQPHALMLSCPLDKRQEMEQVVAAVKAEAILQADPDEPGGYRRFVVNGPEVPGFPARFFEPGDDDA